MPRTMPLPSIKTISKFWPVETARTLRGLLEGTIDPQTFPQVQAWIAQCHNMPRGDELTMCAINELLGGFGTEVIRGRYVDRYHGDIQAEYVNFGDTYDITILLDHETGRYLVTSYGDWVERNSTKREIV